eukprot:1118867-Prymnesium_polylepis.1
MSTSTTNATFYDGEPGLFFFGGYNPRLYGTNEEDVWKMGAAYVITILFAYFVSIYYVAKSLASKMSDADSNGSSRSDQGQQSFAFVVAGWDFAVRTAGGVEREQRQLVTTWREQRNTAKQAEKNLLVQSKSTRNKLLARRFVGVILSLLLIGGGLTIIAIVLLPETRPALVSVSPLMPGLLATLVLTVVPPCLKSIVSFEHWDDPETELIMSTSRIFVIRMAG